VYSINYLSVGPGDGLCQQFIGTMFFNRKEHDSRTKMTYFIIILIGELYTSIILVISLYINVI
jgi:hypothetical protein